MTHEYEQMLSDSGVNMASVKAERMRLPHTPDALSDAIVVHKVESIDQYFHEIAALAYYGCVCHPQEVAAALGKLVGVKLQTQRDGYGWTRGKRRMKALRVELTDPEWDALEYALGKGQDMFALAGSEWDE